MISADGHPPNSIGAFLDTMRPLDQAEPGRKATQGSLAADHRDVASSGTVAARENRPTVQDSYLNKMPGYTQSGGGARCVVSRCSKAVAAPTTTAQENLSNSLLSVLLVGHTLEMLPARLKA